MTSRKLAAAASRQHDADDDRARVAILGREADKQIELAAGRLSSTVTKGSLLLVGAGLIAGSWAIDLVPEASGLLPWTAIVLAFAAAMAAILSLIPQPTLGLDLPQLIARGLAKKAPPSPAELELLVLATKTATIAVLERDNARRTAQVQLGYVLLFLALVLSIITITAVLVEA